MPKVVHDDMVYLIDGTRWLERFLNGETINGIVKKDKVSHRKVKHHMSRAAKLFVQNAQAELIDKLLPKVLEVYQAHLQQQIDNVKAGKPVDLTAADKILKGMFITDSPILKNDISPVNTQLENEEPDTLDALIKIHKGNRKTAKQILAAEVEKEEPKQITEGEVVGHDPKDHSDD